MDSTATSFAVGSGILFLLIFVIAASMTIFWVWMLIECATKEPNENNSRLIWILIILFFHFIGAVLYFAIQRPKLKSISPA